MMQNVLELFLYPPLLYIVSFIFGTVFGSFFNVILYRAGQEDETWYQGRSHCEDCQQPLAWYDNLPLISYFLLKGKCRNCGKFISLIHPAVELGTGLVFLFSAFISFNQYLSFIPALSILDLPWILGFYLVVNAVLWLILLFDVKYMVIPDQLVVIVTVLAGVKQLVFGSLGWQASLITSLVILAFFLALWLITQKKGMGLGDIKLIAPLTFLIGYPAAVVGVFFAFIIGGIWGIILLVTGKKKWGQVLPFGPFLILGAWIAMAWGEEIWQAYWQLV